jgi:hypothetical protein
LSEHAIHSWDVAAALDPASRVAPEAVDLIVDTLGPLAARSGKPDGTKLRLHVSTSGPRRDFTLESGETVTLAPAAAGEGTELPQLQLPAEALVRLVYGRLDPAHTPPVETRGVDLDELRRMFPGF